MPIVIVIPGHPVWEAIWERRGPIDVVAWVSRNLQQFVLEEDISHLGVDPIRKVGKVVGRKTSC